jgi:hypothetical protein
MTKVKIQMATLMSETMSHEEFIGVVNEEIDWRVQELRISDKSLSVSKRADYRKRIWADINWLRANDPTNRRITDDYEDIS